MHSLDLTLFYAIYGFSGHSTWLDLLIVFTGEYLLYVILLVVALYACRELWAHKMRNFYGYIAAVGAALVARFGVAECIRFFYHHPRPFITLNLPHLLTDYSYSFPSGHTIFLFALATAMLYVNKKLAYGIYIAGFFIALARVAGGVHYPSDILGGILLGIATGYVTVAILRKYAMI